MVVMATQIKHEYSWPMFTRTSGWDLWRVWWRASRTPCASCPSTARTGTWCSGPAAWTSSWTGVSSTWARQSSRPRSPEPGALLRTLLQLLHRVRRGQIISCHLFVLVSHSRFILRLNPVHYFWDEKAMSRIVTLNGSARCNCKTLSFITRLCKMNLNQINLSIFRSV